MGIQKPWAAFKNKFLLADDIFEKAQEPLKLAIPSGLAVKYNGYGSEKLSVRVSSDADFIAPNATFENIFNSGKVIIDKAKELFSYNKANSHAKEVELNVMHGNSFALIENVETNRQFGNSTAEIDTIGDNFLANNASLYAYKAYSNHLGGSSKMEIHETIHNEIKDEAVAKIGGTTVTGPNYKKCK